MMEVLCFVFLFFGVLEFFILFFIVLVVVYFGFFYLGELNFGYYGIGVMFVVGFFVLIFVLEFFQLLCDFGMFYYVKVQVVGVVDSLKIFLEIFFVYLVCGEVELVENEFVIIDVVNFIIILLEGKMFVGLLNFLLVVGECVVLVGCSGFGKSFLLNVLFGFFFYQGFLCINGVEFCDFLLEFWCQYFFWVG